MTPTKYKYFFLLIIFCFTLNLFQPSRAQSTGQNYSNINVDALSDAQVMQMMQQAQAAGLSDADLLKQAESKGMSADQIQRLQTRVASLRAAQPKDNAVNTPRKVNAVPDNSAPAGAAAVKSKIFGADLFRNGNTSFEPNLRLATPVNYILGPDDQLDINVYGNSLVNWNLNVSPEGNINIPGVGLLNVAGKSVEAATTLIKDKLGKSNYAVGRGTTVQVTLGNIRSIKVIVNGQVVKPGTVTVPSLATVFHALYACGGPNDNGSFRDIEIIRNNKIIRHLDVYDFLLKGDQKDNIMLHDQDIIRVPTYRVRVDLTGEVKIPALFEVLPGESLKDVIRFAGGFTDAAYTAKIKVVQISGQEKRISDILENDYQSYTPLRGDQYIVEGILNRFENRVSINGAVFRPGDFELSRGLTLSQLVAKAAGLKEDAFVTRGYITRLKPDNTVESIPFNIKTILDKSSPDIVLQREDIVSIPSIFDLRDKYTVTIKGEVRQPGDFDYADSLNVEDLIIKAGGFLEGASTKRIEVARRVTNSDPRSASSFIAQVFSVNVDAQLKPGSANFVLKPFDIVSIYSLPGFEKQKTVKIEGEVLYPGFYTIQKKNEKISDLIARAGGLTASSDVEGASLKRSNLAILGVDPNKGNAASVEQERLDRINSLRQTYKDSSNIIGSQQRNDFVGIDLKRILEKPGSKIDLILEDGDELRVPKEQQIVRVNGEVLSPSEVVYSSGKSFNGYVLNAGGYAPNSLPGRAFVRYPNGTVKGTSKFLFFNNHPSIRPGSEIIVPRKPERRGLTTGEVLGLTSGVASLGAIVLGIITLVKK